MLPIGDLIDLGNIIKILRERQGIRGKDIATRLGVNKGTLSRIERTSKYDPASLERIAAGLGTTAADLLAVTDILKDATRPKKDRFLYCSVHDPIHHKLERILHGSKPCADAIKASIECFSTSPLNHRSLPDGRIKHEELPAAARRGNRMRPRRKSSY